MNNIVFSLAGLSGYGKARGQHGRPVLRRMIFKQPAVKQRFIIQKVFEKVLLAIEICGKCYYKPYKQAQICGKSIK
ncbi:hypothetical protein K1F36_17620 [Muricauda sp. W52]|uniref:Uncharacterized protein n=1 Tax=Flagellimonas abyssi TaxID=2864871 RepID=A0ABS7EVK0_9FLAO|nr:hypothetical protein [Allomuricauda abyssi]